MHGPVDCCLAGLPTQIPGSLDPAMFSSLHLQQFKHRDRQCNPSSQVIMCTWVNQQTDGTVIKTCHCMKGFGMHERSCRSWGSRFKIICCLPPWKRALGYWHAGMPMNSVPWGVIPRFRTEAGRWRLRAIPLFRFGKKEVLHKSITWACWPQRIQSKKEWCLEDKPFLMYIFGRPLSLFQGRCCFFTSGVYLKSFRIFFQLSVDVVLKRLLVQLMEEILHHPEWTIPCK